MDITQLSAIPSNNQKRDDCRWLDPGIDLTSPSFCNRSKILICDAVGNQLA